MSFLQAIIFGIIQGLTEFFPISSSAHLKLAKALFNTINVNVMFDLTCHMGTLLASMLYFRKQIKDILITPKKYLEFTIALIPLIPAYFFLKPYISFFSNITYLGYSLLITSAFLFLAHKKSKTHTDRKYKDMLFIGSMQILALVPGISRSGSTISAARIRGWHMQEAVYFSFLLAIPTILGGFVMEAYKMDAPFSTIFQTPYMLSFFFSFIAGLISLRIFFKILEKEKVFLFGWYCLILGVLSIWYYG